jgi:hypothetical protein
MTVTVSPICEYARPELHNRTARAARAGYLPSNPDVLSVPIELAAKATGVFACLENSSRALSSGCAPIWNTTSVSRSTAQADVTGTIVANTSCTLAARHLQTCNENRNAGPRLSGISHVTPQSALTTFHVDGRQSCNSPQQPGQGLGQRRAELSPRSVLRRLASAKVTPEQRGERRFYWGFASGAEGSAERDLIRMCSSAWVTSTGKIFSRARNQSPTSAW